MTPMRIELVSISLVTDNAIFLSAFPHYSLKLVVIQLAALGTGKLKVWELCNESIGLPKTLIMRVYSQEFVVSYRLRLWGKARSRQL